MEPEDLEDGEEFSGCGLEIKGRGLTSRPGEIKVSHYNCYITLRNDVSTKQTYCSTLGQNLCLCLKNIQIVLQSRRSLF